MKNNLRKYTLAHVGTWEEQILENGIPATLRTASSLTAAAVTNRNEDDR